MRPLGTIVSIIMNPRIPSRAWRHAGAAALALVMAGPALGQSRSDFGAVWCHDTERDAVSRVMPGACAGRIVDDAEAARLRDARADRVKKAIGDSGPRGAPPSWVAPSEPGGPRAAAPRPAPAPGATPPGTPGSEPPPRFGTPVQPEITAGRMAKGSGTGFFVNETGMVLTNFHVAGSCGAITVTGYDQRPVVARVAASAQRIDLLLLSTSTTPPAVAPFSKDPARAPSDRAMLVGFSLKGQPTQVATPSNARIRPTALATDSWRVSFNGRAYPGHSGSPLLNQFGEVVGVVHARATGRIAAAQGDIEMHAGMAVSLRATREFLSESKVSFHPGPAEKSFSDEQILERARRFVVRVQCWS